MPTIADRCHNGCVANDIRFVVILKALMKKRSSIWKIIDLNIHICRLLNGYVLRSVNLQLIYCVFSG